MAHFEDPDDQRGFIQPLRMWNTPASEAMRPKTSEHDPFDYTEADEEVWQKLIAGSKRRRTA